MYLPEATDNLDQLLRRMEVGRSNQPHQPDKFPESEGIMKVVNANLNYLGTDCGGVGFGSFLDLTHSTFSIASSYSFPQEFFLLSCML